MSNSRRRGRGWCNWCSTYALPSHIQRCTERRATQPMKLVIGAGVVAVVFLQVILNGFKLW